MRALQVEAEVDPQQTTKLAVIQDARVAVEDGPGGVDEVGGGHAEPTNLGEEFGGASLA